MLLIYPTKIAKNHAYGIEGNLYIEEESPVIYIKSIEAHTSGNIVRIGGFATVSANLRQPSDTRFNAVPGHKPIHLCGKCLRVL